MTEEAQRVAIAKACGWWIEPRDDGTIKWSVLISPDNKRVDSTSGAATLANFKCIPNYPHSLDAMHEAEKVLTTWELRSKYVDYLDTTIPESGLCFAEDEAAVRYFNAFPAVHATATDKAAAFLRTLNLWDDTK